MITAVMLTSLDEILMARILVGQPVMSAVLKSLERLFQAPPSREFLFAAIDRLADVGLIEQKPFRLTEEGRAQALAFLGLAELPARSSWRTLLQREVPPTIPGVKDHQTR